jgi:hypothetical protein
MAKTTKKRPAIKKVTKKKVTKFKPKKLESKKSVKISNFSFEPIPHPKFSELVIITKAPGWAKETIGKRYLNSKFAEKMITTLCAERLINSAEKAIGKQVKDTLGEEIIKTDVEAVTVSDYDAE